MAQWLKLEKWAFQLWKYNRSNLAFSEFIYFLFRGFLLILLSFLCFVVFSFFHPHCFVTFSLHSIVFSSLTFSPSISFFFFLFPSLQGLWAKSFASSKPSKEWGQTSFFPHFLFLFSLFLAFFSGSNLLLLFFLSDLRLRFFAWALRFALYLAPLFPGVF